MIFISLGTYTIPDVNGDPIVVRYKAGPLTGFVIENLDEVQSRTDPASAKTAPVIKDSSKATPIEVPEPIISVPEPIISVPEPIISPALPVLPNTLYEAPALPQLDTEIVPEPIVSVPEPSAKTATVNQDYIHFTPILVPAPIITVPVIQYTVPEPIVTVPDPTITAQESIITEYCEILPFVHKFYKY